ncbi:MAG: hypothetical protein V4858_17085 [Pseudomonadota bacterium]
MDEQMRDRLHMEIMNIPCKGPVAALTIKEQRAYALGHRDARHAAAELVTTSRSQPTTVNVLLEPLVAITESYADDMIGVEHCRPVIAAARDAIAKATP